MNSKNHNRNTIVAASMLLLSMHAGAIPFSFSTIKVPGAVQTLANGINNAGWIVGSYHTGGFHHGFLYTGSAYIPIDFPGANATVLSGINEAGVTVGQYTIAGGAHGFTFDGMSFTTLDVPGSDVTVASGLNNLGMVVGMYRAAGSDYGFLFDGSSYVTLHVPGAIRTQAYGINDLGQVVGRYSVGGGDRGFLYDAGTYATFEYPGAPLTEIYDINNFGDLSGSYDNPTGTLRHGFVSIDSVLSPLIAAPTYSNALGINDARQVVGWFADPIGVVSYLATPCATEPCNPPNGIGVSEPGVLNLLFISISALLLTQFARTFRGHNQASIAGGVW